MDSNALRGSRPNIVLVVTDDNSFDTVGRYGGGVPSPHLDKLYGKGGRPPKSLFWFSALGLLGFNGDGG